MDIGAAASAGACVPSVKAEDNFDNNNQSAVATLRMNDSRNNEIVSANPNSNKMMTTMEMDKDFMCPICMQTIRDAFLTSCGHSFCYVCIITHLNHKSNCPCCGVYLTNSHLFPNFLLSKLLKKITACQIARTVSPAENLRLSLQQGGEVSVKELDSLLTLLAEKKRKMEQEEAETNMEILVDFLQRLRQQKQEELNEVQMDLQYIKEDIVSVEKRRLELSKARERYFKKLHMFSEDPTDVAYGHPVNENTHKEVPTFFHAGAISAKHLQRKAENKANQGIQRKDNLSYSDAQVLPNLSGLTIARKRRVLAQFEDLQDCYLQKRRRWGANLRKMCESGFQKDRAGSFSNREGYHTGLEEFQSILRTFTHYSRLRVIAELQHGDLFHSANLVSSIEFDRDDELFATAGVSRQIKVFEFATVVNESADVHCPVLEMSTRSKLSCLSWNKYIKSHIASSDYEGIVTVWDVNTSQSIMEYEEHEKRAWSVDFSRTDPTMLISGSDDGKVKVWCTRQEASVLNIDMKANICSVKYNPGSGQHVAVGSADHHIHYYDLRNTSAPLHIFSGHRKAVSYVKFISTHELASASTDSTLRLWDVKENCLLRTFKGHTNEKNFVGLTVNAEHITCGSETNEVFVYHKAISRPAACHKFGNPELDDGDDDSSHFISAVCWKSESPTMLAANSQGTIKVLVLAP